jgi:hypothetical protein
MTFNVDVYFRETYLTTLYGVHADSEAAAIESVQESLEIDFIAEPNE